MKRIRNIHPGEVLQEEFLTPLAITAYRLAKELHIPQTRVAAILKGERRITADTALRLSIYLGTSAKFWLGLQDDYDVEEQQQANQGELQTIKKHRSKAA
jgi:addiction module HigA family antidote